MIKEVAKSTWAPSNTTHTLTDRGIQAGVHMVSSSTAIGSTWPAFPDHLSRTNFQPSSNISDTAFSQGKNLNIGLFEYYAQHPDEMAEFNRFMTVQRLGATSWLDTFPFDKLVLDGADPDQILFVDVGGGVGHQSQAVLKKFPALANRTILQDQSQPISQAPVITGLQTQVIDFLASQPVRNARAYYLRNILHDWNDEHCRKILGHVRAVMGANSLVPIDEMVIPDVGAHKVSMQIDITMLACYGSEERSLERWKGLIGSCGLEIRECFVYQEDIGDSVLVAKVMEES